MLIEDILAIVLCFALLILVGIFLYTVYQEEKIDVSIRRDRKLREFVLKQVQIYLNEERKDSLDSIKEEVEQMKDGKIF